MANVSLIFHGEHEFNTTDIECFRNDTNLITISIKHTDKKWPEFIILDKSTSIKFAKTLRTEINKIEDE